MDIGPFFVDGAVDESLKIGRASALVDCSAIERIFDDIVALDALGRSGARQQIVVGPIGMAGADMTEGVDNSFVGQDAVCGYQFFKNEIEFAHCTFLPCWLQSYEPRIVL